MGLTFIRRIASAAAVVLSASSLAFAANWAHFPINHEIKGKPGVDMRFLLDAPAGKYGFIRVRAGHLVLPTGVRFRCWGVNLAGWTAGSALLPDHADAATYADALARLGVNCVRFQFLDLENKQRTIRGEHASGNTVPVTYTPAGLIESNRDDSSTFDPAQLDKLDFLISQLKSRGIYTDLNLNVGRSYKKGDGVHGYNLIGIAKGITYFDPRLIALQKQYAKQLLTHRNPYTGKRYADDPAVAIVEIVNENSLLEFWMRNWLRGELTADGPRYQLDITPYHKRMLTAQYNAWLAKTRSPAALAHLKALAHVPAGAQVPLLRRGDFAAAPKERLYTELAFYTHVEQDFLLGMERYLKNDLHVKSLVIGTNDHTYFIPGQPLLRTISKLDIVDAHAYWQHPAISGQRNTPMVDDPAHSLVVKLTRSAMAGKPFTVSEVNEPFPNDYEGEFIPILAAYGAFQDWDGIFLYAFEPKIAGKWTPVIGDHFDASQDPVKIAGFPIGATLFLRHDVAAARKVIERTYSTQQINETVRLPQSYDPYFTPGYPLTLALKHGARIRCLDCAPTAHMSDAPADPIMSDTHQLAWYKPGSKGGLVTIDTPRTQAIVGFERAHGITLPNLAADVDNAFSAIALTSLDGKPISLSNAMLLTATGKVQNSGSQWNKRHTMLKAWGKAPTLIEPITGWIRLKDLAGAVAVTVFPLDGSGRALARIPARMLEDGWEFPVGQPSTTTYRITVVR